MDNTHIMKEQWAVEPMVGADGQRKRAADARNDDSAVPVSTARHMSRFISPVLEACNVSACQLLLVGRSVSRVRRSIRCAKLFSKQCFL